MGATAVVTKPTSEEQAAVAQTILAQLGGRRFQVMTGAKHLMHAEFNGNCALLFSIGRGAKDGISRVRVTLEPSDTYRMEFYAVRGANLVKKSEEAMVYCDQLQAVFTAHTGFYTRL